MRCGLCDLDGGRGVGPNVGDLNVVSVVWMTGRLDQQEVFEEVVKFDTYRIVKKYEL